MKVNVQGVASDIIRLESSFSSQKVLHFVFVPGNPGVIYFYSYFLRRLHQDCSKWLERLGYSTRLDAIGHANHHLKDNNDSNSSLHELFGLDDQIEHHLAFVCSKLIESKKNRENTQFVLIGHSIGCYMVLEMLKRSKELKASTCSICLLMPFIFWRNIPLLHKAKLNSFMATRPYSNNAVAWVLSKVIQLNGKLKSGFVRRTTAGSSRGRHVRSRI